MIQQHRWFERRFDFALTDAMFPALVERLRGTPVRLRDRTGTLPPEMLTSRIGKDWSLQEHVGHLGDLEPLWLGRLDDFEAGRDALRPADLENRKTHEANHHASPLEGLLETFRQSRSRMIARLDGYDAALINRSALHPRLQKPMRVLDLAFFIAEHDDHHMVLITQLIETFTTGRAVPQ
jgi:uncharacterized damage-inducible protein DinB